MGSGSDGVVVSSALREQLLSLSTSASKPKGTILFRRGDACSGVFLICKGKVRLVLEDTGPAFPPRILGSGCIVGLPSAIGGSPYSLTAEVVEQAELACVPKLALCECLKQDSQLCFEVMHMLSYEISTARTAIKHSGAHRPR